MSRTLPQPTSEATSPRPSALNRTLRRRAGFWQLWQALHPVTPPIGHPIPRLNLSRRAPAIEFAVVNGQLRVVRGSEDPGASRGGDSLSPRVCAANSHGDKLSPPRSHARDCKRLAACSAFVFLLAIGTGCQVLTYTGPHGERFVRTSLGASTAISSLSVEADTNGLRRVQLQGYQNDSTQALGTVTEAAVRAALQSAK